MQSNSRLFPLLLLTSFLLGMTWFSQEAEAKKTPEKVFRGQIIVSKKRISTRAKSPGDYIKKLRKAKTKRFLEDKKKKSWKIYFAAFFRKPLNDLEVTVKLYDVSSGGKHLINSFEQYTQGKGQTSLVSSIKLERTYFGVNKKILMVMESRHVILAQGSFFIVGEAEKFSGSADFTD